MQAQTPTSITIRTIQCLISLALLAATMICTGCSYDDNTGSVECRAQERDENLRNFEKEIAEISRKSCKEYKRRQEEQAKRDAKHEALQKKREKVLAEQGDERKKYMSEIFLLKPLKVV